ncbi:hypothetical protein Droror1_Dr00007478 [Drosera rotundifolia]
MGTAAEAEDDGGGRGGSREEEEEEEEERGRRNAVFEAGEKRLRGRALMTWPIMERPDHVNPRDNFWTAAFWRAWRHHHPLQISAEILKAKFPKVSSCNTLYMKHASVHL